MPPIAHIVMWRLNGVTPLIKERQAEEIIQAFRRSQEEVPGLLRLEIGRNLCDAGDTWDLALYMVFESSLHLEAYQTNSTHLAIKALVGPMRSSRCQVDFELQR